MNILYIIYRNYIFYDIVSNDNEVAVFWNYHENNHKLKSQKSFNNFALLKIEEMSREVIIGHNVRHIKKGSDQEKDFRKLSGDYILSFPRKFLALTSDN